MLVFIGRGVSGEAAAMSKGLAKEKRAFPAGFEKKFETRRHGSAEILPGTHFAQSLPIHHTPKNPIHLPL